jgi:predicted DNA-binding transcriptional regulator AlpA
MITALLVGGACGFLLMALISINRYAKNDFGRDEPGVYVTIRDGIPIATWSDSTTYEDAQELKQAGANLFASMLPKPTEPIATTAPQLYMLDPRPVKSRLLTAKQAARRLGMSERWLYDHSRDLPFTVKVGRRSLRFDSRILDEWLRDRSAAK